MLIDSKKLISITQLQRELTQKVRDVVSDGETLYITKNSKVEAAVIPFKELEYLRELDEIFEYMEIEDMLDLRMKNYNPQKNIPWDEIKADI